MLIVKWTDEAKTGLYTLLAFIAERNPVAAEALLQRMRVGYPVSGTSLSIPARQGERDA